MLDLTNCELCGQPIEPRPGQGWRGRYPKLEAKRFCSERCRKRAEGRRARQRKREAGNV
jgi:predicted nucleic acid-binding Zn ribbon protein